MSPGVAVPPDQAQIRRTHEARPGSLRRDVRVLDPRPHGRGHARRTGRVALRAAAALGDALRGAPDREDRKSTRLNSSHSQISYAVFCLKKKKQHTPTHLTRSNVPVLN